MTKKASRESGVEVVGPEDIREVAETIQDLFRAALAAIELSRCTSGDLQENAMMTALNISQAAHGLSEHLARLDF
jgi:hypothetical protein